MALRTLLVSTLAILLCLPVSAGADRGQGDVGPKGPAKSPETGRPEKGSPRAEFVPLGFGDGHFWWVTAFDTSDDGRAVVGIGGRAEDGYLEAWRWTPETGIEGLGDLPGWDGGSDAAFESSANGVSGNGKVAVGEGQADTGDQAWRWTRRDGMVAMGTLPGPTPSASRAMATNKNGSVVVGNSSSAVGWLAFRWTAGAGMEPLGTLGGAIVESHAADVSADGKVVVGLSYGASGWEAFRWTPRGGMEGLGQVNGSDWTQAAAVSADGGTVVGYAKTGTHFEAFRWTREGGMELLGDLPGGNDISMAEGVSGDGSIVVGASETSNPYGMNDAFIWDEAHGMRLLQQVLTEEYGLDLAGWRLTNAYAISPDGTCIVGHGWNPDGENEAWLVRLPKVRGRGSHAPQAGPPAAQKGGGLGRH